MVAFHAVVLAAGQGVRMKSSTPKALHHLAGLPLVAHVLKAAAIAGASSCSLVIAPDVAGFSSLSTPMATRVFEQRQRLGTAHAVLAAREALRDKTEPVLILYGDTPLVTPQSIRRLVAAIEQGADVAVIGFYAKNPKGYGRLITDAGRLHAIREEKDATEDERRLTLCNSGIVAFRGDLLLPLLDRIENQNSAGEYYLTDAIEIANAEGYHVACDIVAEDDVRGVNTRAQLAEVEAILQTRFRLAAMEGGATLISPGTVTFCHDTKIGRDVVIEPNVFFGPGVVIEDDVTINGFCYIEGAHIERGAIVGPFARLRPGTRVGPKAKIGNFVELKAAVIDENAKVNHLSYIGDTHIGAAANIGAGTITCNYDGFKKYKTDIGAGAFVGSNSSLIAPVKIGDGAYIGSGSVISKDVPDNALALTRPSLQVREGWADRLRAKHKDDHSK